MITALFDKFFDRILRDAFPSVEPFRFMWSPALSPLKTELLGLRRNWARDEILLGDLIEARNRAQGMQYIFLVPWGSARKQAMIDKLVSIQDRREKRMADIAAKLDRDSKVKHPAH